LRETPEVGNDNAEDDGSEYEPRDTTEENDPTSVEQTFVSEEMQTDDSEELDGRATPAQIPESSEIVRRDRMALVTTSEVEDHDSITSVQQAVVSEELQTSDSDVVQRDKVAMAMTSTEVDPCNERRHGRKTIEQGTMVPQSLEREEEETADPSFVNVSSWDADVVQR